MSHTQTLPIYIHSSIFVGKKPVAVIFGEETEPAHTWTKVYKVILQRAIQDPIYYERLMNLRGRLAGKVRVFISDNPNYMTRAVKNADDLYGEAHYGSATLMHILVNIILKAMYYDYSFIKIVIKL